MIWSEIHQKSQLDVSNRSHFSKYNQNSALFPRSPSSYFDITTMNSRIHEIWSLHAQNSMRIPKRNISLYVLLFPYRFRSLQLVLYKFLEF